jgi:hypothetical protein
MTASKQLGVVAVYLGVGEDEETLAVAGTEAHVVAERGSKLAEVPERLETLIA